MQEIRFRQSEDEVEQYLKGMFESGFMVVEKCDTCGDRDKGLYSYTEGTFTCYKCLARQKFESLVGKPIDF